MQIRWLSRAEADIQELAEYIAKRELTAAQRIVVCVHSEVARLAEFPEPGRPRRVQGTRELVVSRTPYVVAYAVDMDSELVTVLRVLHSARRWPGSLST